MASILIIESHPILREALRRFLFPEHQTVAREGWSGAEDLQGHDLVIVDAEALEEGGGGADALLRALQRLRMPSVWLHGGDAPVLRPGRLAAAVAKPVEGAALEAALRSLLEPRPSRPGSRSGSRPPADPPSGDESPEAGAPDGEIFELTEVVEEPKDS